MAREWKTQRRRYEEFCLIPWTTGYQKRHDLHVHYNIVRMSKNLEIAQCHSVQDLIIYRIMVQTMKYYPAVKKDLYVLTWKDVQNM